MTPRPVPTPAQILRTFLHRLRELAMRVAISMAVLVMSVSILKAGLPIWCAFVPWVAFAVYVVVDLVQKIREVHRDIEQERNEQL